MEFLDKGATPNTSLVSRRTSSIVLITHITHYIHTTFRNLLPSSSCEHIVPCIICVSVLSERLCVQLRKKAGAFETFCVYSVLYVFCNTMEEVLLLASDVLEEQIGPEIKSTTDNGTQSTSDS